MQQNTDRHQSKPLDIVRAVVDADPNLSMGADIFSQALSALQLGPEWGVVDDTSITVRANDGAEITIADVESGIHIAGKDAGTNFLSESPVSCDAAQTKQRSGATMTPEEMTALVGGLGDQYLHGTQHEAVTGLSFKDWALQWLPAWGAHHAR